MPDTLDILAPATITDAHNRRRAAGAAEQRASLADGFGFAFLETIPASAARLAFESGFEADNGFRLTAPLINELADGLDDDLIGVFGRAVSMDHAQYLRASAMLAQDRRNALASLGWTGSALRLGAAISDPAFVGIGLATGGVGFAAAGTKAARLAAMARSGLIAGAPFAALETIRAAEDPSIDALDVLVTGLGGFGFGAAGAATSHLGRATRFAAGGGAQAAPTLLIDSARAALSEDRNADDVLWSAAAQFILGGALNAIPSRRRIAELADMDGAVHKAATNLQRDIEHRQVGELQAKAGTTLTAKGSDYFAEQIDPSGRVNSAADPLMAEIEADVAAAIAREQAAEAGKIARTPLDLGSGVGPLPPIVAPNQVTGYIAISPRARLSFESARTDARAALRADKEARVVIAEYPGGGFAAFRERRIGDPKGTGPFIPAPEKAPKPFATPLAVKLAKELGVDIRDVSPRLVGERIREVDVRSHAEAQKVVPEPTGSTLRQVIESDIAKPTTPRGGIGAATQNPIEFPNPPPAVEREFGDLDLSHVNDAPASLTFMGRMPVSFGMAEQTSHSPVPTIRRAANALGPDPIPKSDGSPSIYTAPEWKADKVNAHVTKVYTGIDAYHAEHQRAATKAGQTPMTREDFNAQVTRAMRRGNQHADPAVRKAAEAADGWTREVAETATRHGVKGFDKVSHRAGYVTRLWNPSRIDALVERFGEAEARRLLGEAVMLASEGLTPQQADTLAKAIIKNGGKVNDGTDVSRAKLFAEDQSEVLATVLKEVEPNLTDAQIEEILYQVKPRDPGVGTIPRARRRIQLDETYKATLTDRNGQRVEMGIEDLLENDIEVLQTLYGRQLYGASAMAEVFRVSKKTPEEVIDTIPQLLSRLEKDARDFGQVDPRGKLTAQAKHHLQNVEVMAKITADIPLREDTNVRRAARILRNLNTFRLMSNLGTGILNFLEVSEPIVRAGIRSTLRIMPEIPKLFARARDGALSNEFLREVEWFIQGSERVARRVLPRAADDVGPIGIGKFEEASARMARFATDAAGISWSQMAAQRITSLLLRERWTALAFKGQKFTGKQLAELGIDAPMADRIGDQLKKHATTDDGFTGVKVRRTNMDRWDDTEAASFFRAALSKASRRLVMVNNPAAYARWMTTDMGKLLSQFRTYTFGAWRNKLLFGVHERNFESLMVVGVTGAAAALGYVARTYMDSLGHPERRKFLRERMTLEKAIAAGVNRAPWSSFVPGAIDTIVSDIGRRKPFFQHGRTTGLGSGLASGIPAIDWLDSVGRAIGSAQAPFFDDYEFSRQDVNAIRDAFWVPNILGLRHAVDHLTKAVGLPEKSKGR